MLDVSTLTAALHAKLEASAALDVLNCERERSVRINSDPGLCPWIGVYPGTVTSVPRNAAGAAAWNDSATLQVVAQTASFGDNGTEASDLLEELIAAINDVIVADLTLGVAGARVTKFDREYRYVVFDTDGHGDLFMPQAIIKLGLELRQ